MENCASCGVGTQNRRRSDCHRVFCSRECFLRKKKLEINFIRCEACEKKFRRPASKLKERNFCSRLCANRTLLQNRKSDKRCAVCDSVFKGAPHRKYCSTTCFGRARSSSFREKHESSIPAGQAPSRVLRKFLLLRGHFCWLCKYKEWNGIPIPLQLDHVDGDNKNNVLENVRLLCPNCHAQTPNWGSKNIGRFPGRPKRGERKKTIGR